MAGTSRGLVPPIRHPPCIALLTDFGHQDSFVGVMKGVMLSINPQVQVVDLCHALDPFDIRQAALHLMVSAPYFPSRTIFVCVVDPGVGSGRRLLAAETDQYTFLGPDNGVLSWVLDRERIRSIVSIEHARYFHLPSALSYPVSTTFHGRDILAPAAAHLSRGTAIRALGPAVQRWIRLPFPRPVRQGHRWVGEVLAIDRFGNLITNFSGEHLSPRQHRCPPDTEELWFVIRGRRIPGRWKKSGGLSRSFFEAPRGALLAVIGSSGYVEIAQREGNAAKALQVSIGTKVRLDVTGTDGGGLSAEGPRRRAQQRDVGVRGNLTALSRGVRPVRGAQLLVIP